MFKFRLSHESSSSPSHAAQARHLELRLGFRLETDPWDQYLSSRDIPGLSWDMTTSCLSSGTAGQPGSQAAARSRSKFMPHNEEKERPHLPSRQRGGRIQVTSRSLYCSVQGLGSQGPRSAPARPWPPAGCRAGPANNHYGRPTKRTGKARPT